MKIISKRKVVLERGYNTQSYCGHHLSVNKNDIYVFNVKTQYKNIPYVSIDPSRSNNHVVTIIDHDLIMVEFTKTENCTIFIDYNSKSYVRDQIIDKLLHG